MISFSNFNFFLLLVVIALLAFQSKVAPYVTNLPVQDSLFSSGVLKGKIESKKVNEASGLAAGRIHVDKLWAHNDSGNKPSIFLMNEEGTHQGEYTLENIENRDWEDIAAGPGPEDGKSYLYIGNIGDNMAQYKQVYVYRFEEPAVSQEPLPDSQTIPAADIDILTLEYPDGPRDAESLLLDPLTKDLYIISKREENVFLYKAAYPQSTTHPIMLEKVGNLPFTWITGGDISADGMEILLKTYDQVFYWKRKQGQSIADILSTTPQQLPYKREPQGEAIAWRRDGSGFFTTSELFTDQEAIIYYYQRLNLD